MEQQWKKSLYVYVDQLNKGRVAPGIEPRQTTIKDPRFLDEQRIRFRRIAQWYSRRGSPAARGNRRQDAAYRAAESRRGGRRCGAAQRILL